VHGAKPGSRSVVRVGDPARLAGHVSEATVYAIVASRQSDLGTVTDSGSWGSPGPSSSLGPSGSLGASVSSGLWPDRILL
jgi:hypothetical protein